MSAADLRRAAEALRERATASAKVSPAPWGEGGYRDCGCCPTAPLVDAKGEGVVDPFQIAGPDAAYIATVHPGVGLALADWLDDEALMIEKESRVTNSATIELARFINRG